MPPTPVSIAVIICAAGSSSRMGGIKKEYLPLESSASGGPPAFAGLTVLGAAVTAFASCPRIAQIVITAAPGQENAEAPACLPAGLREKDRVFFVPGGATRRASVYNALSFLEQHNPSHVLIHDGARPWIKADLVERVIDAAIAYGAVIPALPLTETPKELPGAGKFISRHLRRAELVSAQTPQGFKFPEILRAHEKAKEKEERENFEYTDDAEVWGEFMGQVAVIPGDPENRKITYPEDLGAGSGERKAEGGGRKAEGTMLKIGLGRDLHRLAAGRKFLLGGVEIPFEKGELGHSDGDVLAHAVSDALLGAAGLGDIGELYPPDDPAWKDADSLELLKGAWRLVKNEGWKLVNLDCTVSCEKPKILPHREKICRSLAKALEVNSGSVFVKGKTNEGLGPLGTGEAVEALAVCLLEKQRHEKEQ